MNILMIADVFFPPDPRIWKEATSLINNGYRVTLLCKQRPGEKEHEAIDGIHVRRFRIPESNNSALGYFIEYASFLLLAFFYACYSAFFQKTKIFHCHNPPDFIVPSLFPLKLVGKKIVWDIHDPSPELAAHKLGLSLSHPLVLVFKFFEKAAEITANNIIVAMDLAAGRFTRKKNITEIRNVPLKKFFSIDKQAERRKIRETFGIPTSAVVIGYVGFVNKKRGLKELAEAFKEVNKEFPDTYLFIAGEGEYLPELKDFVEKTKIPNTIFSGRFDHEQVAKIISAFDIGVYALLKSPLHDLAFPVKVFEYKALGVHVLCTDLPGCAQVMKDQPWTRLQLVNATEIQNKLESLLKTKEWSKANYTKEFWEQEEKKLLHLYSTF